MKIVLQRIWLVAVAIWLASTLAESNHHHADKVQCLQCLCLPPGRRKAELAVPATEVLLQRTLDSKRAVLPDQVAVTQAVEFEQALLVVRVTEPSTVWSQVSSRRWCVPRESIASHIFATGPPRGPPALGSSS